MSFVYTLVSSSKGNCTYIGTQNSGILIDAGVGIRNFGKHLNYIDVDPNSINGIFITHEHGDHVSGLKKIVEKYNIPIFASNKTMAMLLEKGCVSYDMPLVVIESETIIDGFTVTPFKSPHDSIDSQCYTVVTEDNKKVAIFTDMGHVTQSSHKAMLDSDLVMIESNYEEKLLKMGGYPAFLKQRILSKQGHLSNKDCAEEIVKLYQNGVKNFVLIHLSHENNMPDLAYGNVNFIMESKTQAVVNKDYSLRVAPRVNEGEIIPL